MLHGNAFNPAINIPYCSYYGFSCVFSTFLYLLFLWRVFTPYAGSRPISTIICLLSAFLYQPIPHVYHLFRIYVKYKGAEHCEATTFYLQLKLSFEGRFLHKYILLISIIYRLIFERFFSQKYNLAYNLLRQTVLELIFIS